MSFRITVRAASLFLFLLLLAVSGCVKRQTVAPPVPLSPYKGPVNADVLKEHRVFQGIATLRAEVKTKVFKYDKKQGTFKGLFAYRAPNDVRLKLLSPMGLTAMEMIITSGKMQMYVPHRDTLYEGPAPRLAMPPDAVYGMAEEEGAYVLYAFRPHSNVMEMIGKYSFQPDTLANTGVTIYRDGSSYLGVMLSEYSGKIPTVIRLSFFNGYVMELELQEPEVDVDLPDKYFEPIVPTDDMKVVPLQLMLDTNENG
jgi:outer membrane lipoprotein-sorting protein